MSTYKKISPSPAPANTVGFLKWIKDNLFSTKIDALLSILSIVFLISIIPPVFEWAFFKAIWSGDSAKICYDTPDRGACWIFIKDKFYLFMYGFYPKEEVYRLNLIIFIIVLSYFMFKKLNNIKIRIAILILFPIISYVLFYGGFGFKVVSTDKWGGLALTLAVSAVGIIASFPIGIIMALARRSNMPVMRYFSIVYIEFIRGVPLITILFVASVILPLFFPQDMNFDKLLRALIGITIFQSAYIAEVVRGGLQSIPKGQYEASEALGLTYWKAMILIILPQALKVSIPNLVGTFISLLKDTTLVLIIGLFDLLGMVNLASSDAQWLGFEQEGYVFVALIFWILCFSMSRYSKLLENRFNTENKA